MLQYVMDNPSDRVTYGDLRLIRAEFEELMRFQSRRNHQAPCALREYVDESFVKNITPARIAL